MINVTKSFLPPKEEYIKYIDAIWQRNWLTNNGPIVNELEQKLKEYLGVKNLLYLNNGTIAIQIAIKALELKGEIITTPFSYVATTSSIVWESCTPIFVDIDENTANINPTLIEKAITPNTSAILATHVYGNPCDIDAIDIIAKKHNLKVIYDAAHCFGTKYKGKSIFEYGDISTTSFHSTKLFHTIEGGAVFSNSDELHHKLSYLRNFGHNGQEEFWGLGINGKNSEVHAAMGICNMKYINDILRKRKEDSLYYDARLKGSILKKPSIQANSEFNFSYYPVFFESEEQLLKVQKYLNSHLIYPRRYFYPSLNLLPYVQNSKMEITESLSGRVLCLPLYFELTKEEIDLVCKLIMQSIQLK